MKSDSQINDGGPAFPVAFMDFQPTTGDQVVREQYSGMTLRDYFRGQALAGLCANGDYLSELARAIVNRVGECEPEHLAQAIQLQATFCADAMLNLSEFSSDNK